MSITMMILTLAAVVVLWRGWQAPSPAEVPKVLATYARGEISMALVVEPSATLTEAGLRTTMLRACEGRDVCLVGVWDSDALAPRSVMMSEEQARAMLYSYALNRYFGDDRGLWNCRLFPEVPRDRCFNR